VNTEYKEDQSVNIVKSHENSQRNMNSKTKRTQNIVEELN